MISIYKLTPIAMRVCVYMNVCMYYVYIQAFLSCCFFFGKCCKFIKRCIANVAKCIALDINCV
jgi:hypothetical protein